MLIDALKPVSSLKIPGISDDRPSSTPSLSTIDLHSNHTSSPLSQAGGIPHQHHIHLPESRFPSQYKPINNKSTLLKQFFPGDDEEEQSEAAPASSGTTKTGPAGWQRIDGGGSTTAKNLLEPTPMRSSRDYPSSPRATPMGLGPSTHPENGIRHSPTSPMDIDARPVQEQVPGLTITAIPIASSMHGSNTPIPGLSVPSSLPPKPLTVNTPPLAPRPLPITKMTPMVIRPHEPVVASTSSAPTPVQQTHTNGTTSAPSQSKPKNNSSAGPAPSHNGDIYTIMNQVGEGTFGQVYKAVNSQTGSKVALKRIRMETEKDGFPVTAMREIKLLQSLRHENVVKLHEMMVSKSMC